MAKIKLLDKNTVNKIAAGEVVERPVAVVKELAENAIDADASAITIEIKEGGISLIRITDNGSGIEKEDIRLAFQAHATSKIQTMEDLLSVSSLGFRGEALSSIAAVTQLELVTKTPSALTGCRYVIEGSEEKALEDVGCPDGTTFLVRNLFYNTPARQKFLKTAMTEAGYIHDLVTRIALSHPSISVKFINNNQVKINTPGNGKLKDVIYQIFGRDICNNLLETEKSTELCTIKGFIGKPVVSRGNRNYMNYFLNGRYIKSTIIDKAILDSFKPYSMSHRFPFTALHLTMDPSLIDVNVHPTKMEVRFGNDEALYRIIREAITEALEGKSFIPEVTLDTPKEGARKEKAIPEKKSLHEDVYAPKKNVSQKESSHEKIYASEKNYTSESKAKSFSQAPAQTSKQPPLKGAEPFEKQRRKQEMAVLQGILKEEEIPYQTKDTPKQMQLFDDTILSKNAAEEYKIIGQLFQTYWIMEYQDKMFIVDQHAAHEKVLYEEFMEKIEHAEVSVQMLNPPMIVTLSPGEENVIKEHKQVLERLGFILEPFGGKEYAVSGVPAHLPSLAREDLFLEVLGALEEEAGARTPEILLERVASMSCKAAVKGNTKMSVAEADALLKKLMTLSNPFHCPHGRPTIISMTKYEIEKKFKRIV